MMQRVTVDQTMLCGAEIPKPCCAQGRCSHHVAVEPNSAPHGGLDSLEAATLPYDAGKPICSHGGRHL